MHGSHDHSQMQVHANNEWRMGVAALLTGSFMFVELAGGIIANSLALIADAGHMLTDFASLTLAWFAFRLARRPADWKRTYGFDRFQVLVAFSNGLALFAIAGWIIYEAIHRLSEGEAHVAGGIMVVVGIAGLLVNIASFWMLRGADRENLNVRSAAIHVLGDLLGSVAALIAGAVIMLTGWTRLDAVVALAVAINIVITGGRLVYQSIRGLMDAAEPTQLEQIVRALKENRRAGWIDAHRLRMIRAGDGRHLDLHLTVPRFWDIERGHEEQELLERTLSGEFPGQTIHTADSYRYIFTPSPTDVTRQGAEP